MPQVTRPNGSDYFTTLPGIDPDIGAAIDAEINAIVAAANALDNANIADTPKIAGSKVDLEDAGFLPEEGGTLSALLTHGFDGIWRKMRTAGNGRIREYRGSDGAIWGISYNTEWTGSDWAGRDITDVCLALKLESDGLHLYYAASGAATSAPSWTEVFHAETNGDLTLAGHVVSESIKESSIDWANSGGMTQQCLNHEEITPLTHQAWGDMWSVRLYVPANANDLEYSVEMKDDGGGSVSASFRINHAGATGTTATVNSDTYAFTTGQVDVSAISGWTTFTLQHQQSDNNGFLRSVAVRFI